MELKGLGVAMVTPFKKDLTIDFIKLEKLTLDLISGGIDFLVVMGTTGESVTLNSVEKELVLRLVIETAKDQIPIVYGLGGNNTMQLCDELKDFNPNGVSAILSVSPSYSKPTQEGIFQHYKAIGDASPLPIILYNVPGRTGSNVLPETCIRIANEVENVVAVKEASGDLAQIEEIIKQSPEGFSVFSGDDAATIPVMLAGGVGVISVLGNAMPDLYSELVNQCLRGNFEEAKVLDIQAQKIIPLLFKEGNPAGIKCLMSVLNDYPESVRLPLISASNELKMQFLSVLNDIKQPA